MNEVSIWKKKEMIIWGVLIAAAAGIFFLLQMMQKPGEEVVVTISGKEVWRLPINQDKKLKIEGKNGFYVELQIKNEEVTVVQASCPDQICVNHGALLGTADSIVCLPAQIIVSLDSEETKSQKNDTEKIDGIVR